VRPQDREKYKTFRDFKGATIGVTSPGSATHVLGVWMAHRAGLGRDEVTFVGVGAGATMPAALGAGQVAAAIGNDPFVSQLIRAGRAAPLIELFRTADVRAAIGFSAYCFTGALTRAEVAQKNPERTQRVVNALARAQRFMGSHTPEQVAAALPEDFRGGVSVADFAAGFRHSRPAFTQDGAIALEGVRAVMVTNGFFLGNQPSADPVRLFDNRFVTRARSTAG
jgi:NitT/TauT family transport system substrate-binding protein